MKVSPFFAILSASALFLASCQSQQTGQQAATTAAPATVRNAIAVLHSTEGNTAAGVVTFSQTEGGVRVVATISGLTPGEHGFHIHQYGDCSASDATSAGGHFNPAGEPHAGPHDAKRHVGDMGNITANEDGNASLDYVDTMMSLSGANSIIGRGVIVHSNRDDLTTQPTGNAGSRVACGVVGIGKE